eukprot:366055-Chlamydomonas_euryale.AAC.23
MVNGERWETLTVQSNPGVYPKPRACPDLLLPSQELRSAGAPGDGPAYACADTASQAFQAVAPIGVKLFRSEKLLLPEAN